MAGTAIVAARQALVAALDALSALDGIPVSYSYAAKLADGSNREFIYGGGSSEATVAQSAMKGPTGRIKRDESATWALHVMVVKPGEVTTEAGDARAVAIGTVIENYIAANPTLGGTVLFARISSWSLTSNFDDDATYSLLSYSIAIESYLI